MSKLDEIFEPIDCHSHGYMCADCPLEESKPKAKQQIKDLMLELIEQTDPGKSDSPIYWGNQLRQKVSEL